LFAYAGSVPPPQLTAATGQTAPLCTLGGNAKTKGYSGANIKPYTLWHPTAGNAFGIQTWNNNVEDWIIYNTVFEMSASRLRTKPITPAKLTALQNYMADIAYQQFWRPAP
jgi:hypothetical protein